MMELMSKCLLLPQCHMALREEEYENEVKEGMRKLITLKQQPGFVALYFSQFKAQERNTSCLQPRISRQQQPLPKTFLMTCCGYLHYVETTCTSSELLSLQ